MNLMFRKNFREGGSSSSSKPSSKPKVVNRNAKRSRDMSYSGPSDESFQYRTHLFFSANRTGAQDNGGFDHSFSLSWLLSLSPPTLFSPIYPSHSRLLDDDDVEKNKKEKKERKRKTEPLSISISSQRFLKYILSLIKFMAIIFYAKAIKIRYMWDEKKKICIVWAENPHIISLASHTRWSSLSYSQFCFPMWIRRAYGENLIYD